MGFILRVKKKLGQRRWLVIQEIFALMGTRVSEAEGVPEECILRREEASSMCIFAHSHLSLETFPQNLRHCLISYSWQLQLWHKVQCFLESYGQCLTHTLALEKDCDKQLESGYEEQPLHEETGYE